MVDGDWFSTTVVAELSGASLRQLNYWDHTGVLPPSIGAATGSGTRRRYSFDDIRIAIVLVALTQQYDVLCRFEYRSAVADTMRAEPDAKYLVIGDRARVWAYVEGTDAVAKVKELTETTVVTLVAIEVLLDRRDDRIWKRSAA